MAVSPLYIPLPGMEVYLADTLINRPANKVLTKHIHTAYELIYIQTETGSEFRIIPPYLEHFATDASQENVISFLFSFTESQTHDICQALRSIKDEPVSFIDDFQGYMRIQNVKQLAEDLSQPGVFEQIAAELRLLFVRLARKQSIGMVNIPINYQTLDNKRLAIMEDFFTVIGVKDLDCSKAKLAFLLGVSERQLTRILEQTYHSTFSKLLLRSRMQIAHAHILEGTKTLKDISERVGFRSVDTFKRAYREYFGVSLQTYKKKS